MGRGRAGEVRLQLHTPPILYKRGMPAKRELIMGLAFYGILEF